MAMKRSQSNPMSGDEEEEFDTYTAPEGEDGPPSKRGRAGRGDPNGPCAFKILCPDGLTANIIGNGGSNRKAIEEETTCRVKISRRDSFYPNTRFRTCSIIGDDQTRVAAAVEKILDHYIDYANRERDDGKGKGKGPEESLLGKDDGEFIFRTCIPKEAAGYIIGPGGAHIKAMRADTGAKVFVENETHHMHQMVRIIGNVDMIRGNIERLMSGICEDLTPEKRVEWGDVADFPDGGGDGGKGGKGSKGGKGKDDRRDDNRRDDRRDDRRGDDRREQYGGRGHYEEPVREYREHSRRGDNAPGAAGVAPEMILDLAANFPGHALEMAHAVSCELPHARIGSLIGSKGKYVHQVERETGAKVNFSDPPKGEKSEHRTMSITGPLISVYAAHMMMMKEYHEAERREQEAETQKARSATRKVDDLQNQLEQLQRQLNDAKKGAAEVTRGGGGGGKGGKRR